MHRRRDCRPEAITRSRWSLGSVPLHRSCLRPPVERFFYLKATASKRPGANRPPRLAVRHES
ncbi:MAG: hypothetical protein LBQ54_13035 [Planctomycetaceae bacterium]|nr:hypothetical protein [Planctomycetaceae bacterium]